MFPMTIVAQIDFLQQELCYLKKLADRQRYAYRKAEEIYESRKKSLTRDTKDLIPKEIKDRFVKEEEFSRTLGKIKIIKKRIEELRSVISD